MENFDFEKFFNFLHPLKSEQKRWVFVVGVGISVLFVVLFGLVVFAITKENKKPIQIQKSQEIAKSATPTPIKKIVVDIAGAVKFPGVYEFLEGSRLQEVIEKAGGVSSEADQDYISKYINLSQIVSDADKVYIPKIGEESSKITFSGNTNHQQSSGTTAGTKATRLININTASKAQLETLPSIGPAYAQKIIEGRPYQKIEDILRVKGIGEKTFEKIKDLITVK